MGDLFAHCIPLPGWPEREAEVKKRLAPMLAIPAQIEKLLATESKSKVARKYSRARDFLGRGINYPVAEGTLKLQGDFLSPPRRLSGGRKWPRLMDEEILMMMIPR